MADWDNRDYVPENEPVQHKQHHPRHQQQQQQYEGEDGPGPQYENRSNQAGGYGPGGGPGANQDFPIIALLVTMITSVLPSQSSMEGAEVDMVGRTITKGQGQLVSMARGDQFSEHPQQHRQRQHPGGEYEGERPRRDEYEGEYGRPPPSEYGNRQGQGYAHEGGRQGQGYGQEGRGGGGYNRDDGYDEGAAYGGGGGSRRTQVETDEELAKKLDADLNHGGEVVGGGGQQIHPPGGAPPAGGPPSGGQQFHPPGSAPPPGGPQYGGQQFHPPGGAPPPGGPPSGYGEQQYRPPATSQGPPQSYSHIPALAAEHDTDTDPAVYQQAIQRLHQSQSQGPPPVETDDSYNTHVANHAQAYGPNADHAPMSPDDIGSAAAMEAFKMSGGHGPNSQAPTPAAHPDSHVTSTGGYPAYPSSPASASQSAPASGEEEQAPKAGGGASDFLSMAMGKLGGGGGGASPGGGGAAPSNPQDKLVALAMAQAGKLFDKKNGTAAQGGNQDAKAEAMHAAAATAMRLAGTYKTTGKLSLQSGDMQQLMGAAMSFLQK